MLELQSYLVQLLLGLLVGLSTELLLTGGGGGALRSSQAHQFAGLPMKMIPKLQLVQNATASILLSRTGSQLSSES